MVANCHTHTRNLRLILGSSSPFRQSLLQRLGLDFSTAVPDIDESSREGESPQDLVTRLAEEKARAVAQEHPRSLIIGCDQVACIDGEILGKPGNRQAAIQQLSRASGNWVHFFTGLCLLNSESTRVQVVCEPFQVQFRRLSRAQIESYLDREQPFNCAGSFRSEGLGIALFERMRGDDPNALIGLPMIRLITLLGNEEVTVI